MRLNALALVLLLVLVPLAAPRAAGAVHAAEARGAHAGADPASPSAALACTALRARVDAVPGGGPLFLRSFDAARGEGPPEDPALATAAFTYDNALAAVALIACGDRRRALRIGEALLAATAHDRSGVSGRVRNAYRAGSQHERPLPPMGWWDEARSRWLEDPYQVGSASGNVAWAGLALLALHAETADPRFAEGAGRAARWLVAHARDEAGPGGVRGGLHGFDAAPQALGWKSTEHNVDAVALFDALACLRGGEWRSHARHARHFVDAMWDESRGRFLVGTAPDGRSPNLHGAGLDAQLWPLMLRDAPRGWLRALEHVERAHRTGEGYDFNDDRDGVWVEGTAQAALAYRLVGGAPGRERASALLARLAQDLAPGGYAWATRSPRITTGLAIGPDSTTDDFRYYRMPHLGATAWIALAALGHNPFQTRITCPFSE